MVILSLVLLGCNSHRNKMNTALEYWVNSYKVPCEGVAPMHCLQVSNERNGEWKNFFSNIKGFDYEPGYLYKIRVNEEVLKADEVPADASSVKYTLISILEKKFDKRLLLNDIWALQRIVGNIIDWKNNNAPEESPYIEVNLVSNRVLGSDGCNTIRSSLVEFDDYKISFAPFLSTKMACENRAVSTAFVKNLGEVDEYEIKEKQLVLSSGGRELLSFKKVD